MSRNYSKKANGGKHHFIFVPPHQPTLNFFCIHLFSLKYQQLTMWGLYQNKGPHEAKSSACLNSVKLVVEGFTECKDMLQIVVP